MMINCSDLSMLEVLGSASTPMMELCLRWEVGLGVDGEGWRTTGLRALIRSGSCERKLEV